MSSRNSSKSEFWKKYKFPNFFFYKILKKNIIFLNNLVVILFKFYALHFKIKIQGGSPRSKSKRNKTKKKQKKMPKENKL